MKTFNQKIKLSLLVLSVSLVSCRTPVQEPVEKTGDEVEEQFLRVNQYIRDKNQDQISAFVARVGWPMQESQTGLWYRVIKSGNEKPIRKESSESGTSERG